MVIALDKAAILALFLETLLYGIYLVLFCLTLSVLLLRGESGKTQRHRLVPLSIAMMILATTHLIIDFVRAIQAFVVKDGRQIDAIAYYSAIAHPLNLVKGAFYVTQTTLGDAIMIWRCYVILDQRLLVLLPNLVVLLINSGAGCAVVWKLWKAPPGKTIFQSGFPWIMDHDIFHAHYVYQHNVYHGDRLAHLQNKKPSDQTDAVDTRFIGIR